MVLYVEFDTLSTNFLGLQEHQLLLKPVRNRDPTRDGTWIQGVSWTVCQ